MVLCGVFNKEANRSLSSSIRFSVELMGHFSVGLLYLYLAISIQFSNVLCF